MTILLLFFGGSLFDFGSLRYPTLLLWPFTPTEVLNSRLDVRVDHMVNVSDAFVLGPGLLMCLTERPVRGNTNSQ